jgi:hypothetical protein
LQRRINRGSFVEYGSELSHPAVGSIYRPHIIFSWGEGEKLERLLLAPLTWVPMAAALERLLLALLTWVPMAAALERLLLALLTWVPMAAVLGRLLLALLTWVPMAAVLGRLLLALLTWVPLAAVLERLLLALLTWVPMAAVLERLLLALLTWVPMAAILGRLLLAPSTWVPMAAGLRACLGTINLAHYAHSKPSVSVQFVLTVATLVFTNSIPPHTRLFNTRLQPQYLTQNSLRLVIIHLHYISS